MANNNFRQIANKLNSISTVSDFKNGYFGIGITSILSQLPVIGHFVNDATDLKLNNFQEKKRRELINHILHKDTLITNEMVNDIEFLINFSKTLDAINKLATNDKVFYFAQLIKNSYFTDTKISNDDFEQYFKVIESLSYKEITLLIFLRKHEENMNKHASSTINISQEISDEFNKQYPHFATGKIQLDTLCSKLVSTGLIKDIIKSDGKVKEKPTNTRHYDGVEYALTMEESMYDGYFLTESFYDLYEYIKED